jgi:hypothetical protein
MKKVFYFAAVVTTIAVASCDKKPAATTPGRTTTDSISVTRTTTDSISVKPK